MRVLAGLIALLLIGSAWAEPAPVDRAEIVRPVSTYSIVARDGETGELGVAVQSHWFDVGSVVPWAEAGVGAVATQSLVLVRYGPLGLELMRGGLGAVDALNALLEADEGREVRQVAMIDADGTVAIHTGDSCIRHASGVARTNDDGDSWACQANMMHFPGVAQTMSDAFASAPADADLAERMMLALEAAQAAGGDIRGKQSASMLVVGGKPGDGWRGRRLDLRIADHPDPLVELRRQLELHRAYEHMNAGDEALETGDLALALEEYRTAQRLNPTNVEMSFWTGVTLAGNGLVDESIPFFARAFADPNMLRSEAEGGADWAELLRRLPASGLFPDDPELIDRILTDAAPAATAR